MLSLLAEIPYPDIPPLPLGPLKLYPFGFLVGVAIIVGTMLADKRASKLGLSRKVVSEVSLWAVIPGFIISHLYSVIFYTPEKIAENPLILLEVWNGISSFGGFIGGALGVIFYLRWKKVPFWAYAECIAYGFTFAWVFGRLGCTVAFDHPGSLTDFALAMAYPESKASATVPAGLRHNLGFYEFIWAVAMSAWFFTQRNKAKWSGWYLTMFLVFYCPIRFTWDFFRAVDKTYFSTDSFRGLTAGQLAAVGLFALSLWMWKTRRHAELLVPDGKVHVFPDGTPAIALEASAAKAPAGGGGGGKKQKAKKR